MRDCSESGTGNRLDEAGRAKANQRVEQESGSLSAANHISQPGKWNTHGTRTQNQRNTHFNDIT